jgi:predicted methyltransferase
VAESELSFFRWARLRDFSEMGLALSRPHINEFIKEGYLERTETAVILTEKGKEALTKEPAV